MLQKWVKKVLEGVLAGSSPGVGYSLGTFLVLSPDGDSEALLYDAILIKKILLKLYVCIHCE